MRFKDFLTTILISTITSLIVIWTLINAGIIPTRQQYLQFFLKQHHSGTLVGVFNETSRMYEANIDRLPIENVSNRAIMRFLHVSFEANVTNYDIREIVNIKYLRLADQELRIVSEKNLSFAPKSYASLAIDTTVSPLNVYHISLEADGTYNFTLTYDLTIIQEVLT